MNQRGQRGSDLGLPKFFLPHHAASEGMQRKNRKRKRENKGKGREREEQGRKEIGNFFRLGCLTLKEN